MSEKATTDDIKATRAMLDEIAGQMQKTKDVKELGTLSERVKLVASQLERQAITYEAQQAALLPPGAIETETRVKVQLTPQQRTMVMAETGLSLEEVELVGSGAVWLHTLPNVVPAEINRAVLKAARRLQAEQDARREAEMLMAKLNATEDPKLKAQLQRARKDPNFMGGLLNKK